jgi:quercetin dioxygenase-like cupin family protein
MVSIEQEPRHHLVIANEFVRGFAVEIAPHDRTLCHHHAHEYLVYVAGEAQIVSTPSEGDPKTHSYQDGECEFSPPGLVHTVENLRDANFRNLLVEFLPGAQGLRRGPAPKTVSDDLRTRCSFANDRVSVWLLEMGSGSQAEVFGPAIVASPYEHEVELAPSQATARTIAHFRDLQWLDPSTPATLSNRAATAAKLVFIAVGQK